MPEKEMLRQELLIVLPSLMPGGAERSLVSLALQIRRHFPVALAAVRATGGLSLEIGKSLTVHDLGGRLTAMFRLVRLVRKQRPAVILSTMWDLNLLVLFLSPWFPSSTRVAVREAVIPNSLSRESRWPRLWRFLYRHLYRRADAVIVMTEEMKQVLHMEFGIPATLITVIPNAIPSDRCNNVIHKKTAPKFPTQLVSMGRLVKQKGYDVLLRSFVHVVRVHPGAKLKIYGEGPQRQELQRLVENLKLGDHVSLPGVIAHSEEALKSADLYILSSRYEGMSNAMLEALCAGVPVVAVCRHTGVKDVITEGFNGFLVSDCADDELSNGILRAMRECGQLDRKAISDDAKRRFSGTRFVRDYLRLLARISPRL